jgi:F-type H+-transporting ATPase subunit b
MLNRVVLVAAEGANGFWLPADIKEVIWNSTAFFIVVALLWKFTRKPVAEFFNGRTRGISDELEASASTRTAAEEERDRVRTALAGAEDEASVIIEQARHAAEQLRLDIAERTAAEVARIRATGAAELADLRARAETELSADLTRLSLGAAEHVVERSLDESAQQRLIDDYITRVARN